MNILIVAQGGQKPFFVGAFYSSVEYNFHSAVFLRAVYLSYIKCHDNLKMAFVNKIRRLFVWVFQHLSR